MKVLVANLGSTSFKYRLFDLNTEEQLARGGIDRIGQPANGQPIVDAEPHVDERSIHMPSPSYWPIWIGAGVALLAGGIVSHFALSFFGGFVVFLGIIGWSNEPAAAPDPHHAAPGTQH